MLIGCSELGREKMWSRIHLIPLLQAEEDRDLVRRHLADSAREKELLGSETKAYNSDRYAIASTATQSMLTMCLKICPPNLCSHTKGRHEISPKLDMLRMYILEWD